MEGDGVIFHGFCGEEGRVGVVHLGEGGEEDFFDIRGVYFIDGILDIEVAFFDDLDGVLCNFFVGEFFCWFGIFFVGISIFIVVISFF